MSTATRQTLQLNWDETPEEKRERIDQILERNTRETRVCVACQTVISDTDNPIKTPYGWYHGAPFTCTEDGIDDADIPWYSR